MSRRGLIVANWKMNLRLSECLTLAGELSERLRKHDPALDVWLAPTSLHVAAVANNVDSELIAVAGQNCHQATNGAYTGEISADMLRDVGAGAVVLGHSERRQLFAENDQLIAEKTIAVAKAGIKPLVCMGETLTQRDAGQTLHVVTEQLRYVLSAVAETNLEPGDLSLAYEPVWAIGTGRAATPDDADEVLSCIRAELRKVLGDEWADKTRVLYGGSVSPDNATAFCALVDCDGLLVGGASLKAQSFEAIINAGRELGSQ